MNTVIAEALAKSDVIYWGKYVGSLGLPLPCWTDPRRVLRYPQHMQVIAEELAKLVKPWGVQLIAGASTAGIPYAAAAAQAAGLPMVYVTKEAKKYGTKSAINGVLHQGERTILIDDANGNGSTKIPMCENLIAAGAKLQHVVVLLGVGHEIVPWYKEHGVAMHELVQFHELVDYLLETNRLSKELHDFIRDTFIYASDAESYSREWTDEKWQRFLAQVKTEGIDYQL